MTVGNRGESLVVGVMSPDFPCSWFVDTSVLWFSIQRAGANGQTQEPGNKISSDLKEKEKQLSEHSRNRRTLPSPPAVELLLLFHINSQARLSCIWLLCWKSRSRLGLWEPRSIGGWSFRAQPGFRGGCKLRAQGDRPLCRPPAICSWVLTLLTSLGPECICMPDHLAIPLPPEVSLTCWALVS